MEISHIKYFLVLADELHFWNTAEKISISQSSLSRHIQALENELGFQLLSRDKRNVKLTDAGKFFQQQWSSKINQIDQIQRQAKKIYNGDSGSISISYPGSTSYQFLPNFIAYTRLKLPDLKLELVEPTDENHEKLLLNYETDVAFSRDEIQNGSIETRKLYSEPVCLVVSNDHWVKYESFKELSDFKNEQFIISGLHQKTFFATLLRSIFSKYKLEPKINIESDYGGMILNLVRIGLGISILPHSFKYANVENVKFIEMKEEIDLYVNWRKNEINKTVLKIIDYSNDVCR